MEYAEYGTLSKYLEEKCEDGKNIDEAEAARIVLEICLGVNLMHSKNILHRDLKPDNILVHKVKKFENDNKFTKEESIDSNQA